MKKFLAALLAGLFLLTLCACGAEPAPAKETQPPVSDETEQDVVDLLIDKHSRVPLYEQVIRECRERGFHVETGVFAAEMKVDSENDGPVTILLDTNEL